MKYLIVGLGNPGPEYENTRHNIGFNILDQMLKDTDNQWTVERHGWIARLNHKGRTLILLKPSTYMNLSGKAVAYWMQQEKIKRENILVVVDDLALPVGKLRLRLNGSDGGHNGLRSIDATLGMQNYARLRFGIGNDFPRGRQAEFVLGAWNKEEEEIVRTAIVKAAESVSLYVTLPPGMAMTRVNAQ